MCFDWFVSGDLVAELLMRPLAELKKAQITFVDPSGKAPTNSVVWANEELQFEVIERLDDLRQIMAKVLKIFGENLESTGEMALDELERRAKITKLERKRDRLIEELEKDLEKLLGERK